MNKSNIELRAIALELGNKQIDFDNLKKLYKPNVINFKIKPVFSMIIDEILTPFNIF